MLFIKKRSRKQLIILTAFTAVIAIVLALTYIFPASTIGQTYLSQKAYQKYTVNFQAINQELATLPKNKPVYYNGPVCTSISLHEPDPGEHSWIQECSVTKVWYINTANTGNIKGVLAKVSNQLAMDGWKFESSRDGKPVNRLDPNTKDSSSYWKNDAHSRGCYISFNYDDYSGTAEPSSTITIIEECGYYYRSILDL